MADDKKVFKDRDALKKANSYFFGKMLFNFFLVLFGAVLIAIFLRQMQAQTALVKQEENSRLALEEAVTALEDNVQNADSLAAIFHDGNQDELDDMYQLFTSGMFESMADLDNKQRSEVFADMVERSGVQYLFLMTMDGRIVLSQSEAMYGINPASGSYMTQENINQTLKGTKAADGTITPVTVKNRFGTFYFYIKKPLTNARRDTERMIRSSTSSFRRSIQDSTRMISS